MNQKCFEKSKYKKLSNNKIHRTFIEDYKQSHNKNILKMPNKIVIKKDDILLGIFQKRQRFNEFRTVRAVENCRRQVFEEIERFFEYKEKTINSILPDLIINRKAYSLIFNNNDLEMIYRKTEDIIINELSKRFKSLVVWQSKKENSDDWISSIFAPVQKYQKIKKRTVFITSYIEALSRRTLSDSIDSLMNNSLLAELVCNLDISTILLPKLGVNSGLETRELNGELIYRISGALYSIKVGLIQEMNNQIANIFYETHDLQLNSAMEHKIYLLEEKIAFAKNYETDLLEA